MDRRVIIQTRAVEVDAYGDQIETWNNTYTVWSAFLPKRLQADSLAELARQDQFFEGADFIIRFKNIPTDARILYNNAVWKVVSRREIGRQDRLALTAYRTDSNLYD